MQVTWKRRVIGKDSFEQAQIIGGTVTRKLTNTPAGLFVSLLEQFVYIHETHYYYIILSYYLLLFDLKFFKIGNNLCWSLFLIHL